MSTFVIVRSYQPWDELEDWKIAGVFDLPDVEHARALINGKYPYIEWSFEGDLWHGKGYYGSDPDWIIVESPLGMWLLRDS